MDIKPGDKVRIICKDDEFYDGIFIDKKKDTTVIKSGTGYNIGVLNSTIKDTKLVEKGKDLNISHAKQHEPKAGLPTISILHTGGTIASKVDYRTGAVVASFNPEDLIGMFPELLDIANINSHLIGNMFSDDMRFKHYSIMAEAIEKEIEKGVEGKKKETRFQGFLNAQYKGTFNWDENVEGQNVEFGSDEHEFITTVPVFYKQNDAILSTLRLNYRSTDTEAVFPATNEVFPEQLWTLELGALYRHMFQNGWMGGAYLSFGSASDTLFDSTDEIIYGATGYLLVPHRDDNAWLFALNIANNREFLRNIPLPGIAYIYNASEDLRIVVGVPFEAVHYRPIEKLTFDFVYLPLRTVSAKCTYELFNQWKLYVAFRWYNDQHLLADRANADDRLYFYEKRILGGLKYEFNEYVSIDLSGGLAFDRFYFIAEEYDDRNQNRIDIEDGPFIAVRALLSF